MASVGCQRDSESEDDEAWGAGKARGRRGSLVSAAAAAAAGCSWTPTARDARTGIRVHGLRSADTDYEFDTAQYDT